MTCPDETNDRGRTSNDPCKGFCGAGDFDAWRKTALWDVGLALQRKDLDASTRSTLLQWNQMVETMPRPVLYADGEVRMFASIAKQAKCIAMSESNLPVIVPIRPSGDEAPGIPTKYWVFAAVAAGLFFYFGGPAWVAKKAISRVRRGRK